MAKERVEMIKPGLFGNGAAADSRRMEFDYGNEILVNNEVALDYVFIGDSITHMWELNAYFAAVGRVIVNRGIGGDISSHVLRRFDADVLQLKPKHAVIKIGINNTWALDEEGGKRKTADQIVSELLSDIGQMLRKATAAGIVPIICSILPTNVPQLIHDQTRNDTIVYINGQLQNVAGKLGAIYVDYHSRMIVEGGSQLRAELADDGVHPHVLGYNIMAQVLRETLKSKGIEI